MPVLTKINTNVIADNAVTAAKIPAGAVAADIGADGITANEIAANAVGSSEIADDAVLPANIAYLGDGTGKLSGTITGQQLRLGTAFTLTDDLTVNGDLTLSKVRADGTGQSLTQDSSANRTITGTGTLRMGHATEKTSISGFTGVLDPAVTGQHLAKAWVNFNGDGTVAIRDSFNVSSITDNDTGDYYVNFTTAMSNTNYAVALASGGSSANFTLSNPAIPAGLETTRFRIQNVYQHGSSYKFNPPHVGAIVFGD